MWRGESSRDGPAEVIGIRTFGDELLSAIAPLGLAAAAGTALVVDLDPDGPPYPGERSLAELVEEGPRRAEMAPDGSGVAALRNGGASSVAAVELVGTLAAGWPAIVVRVGDEPVPFPVVPVRSLWPGWMAPSGTRPSVWQSFQGRTRAPGPGPVLPPPGRTVVTALLHGRRPMRSRWIRAWRQVWELPWQ